ncbi:MAG: hypothetical protein WCI00_04930 [bacterium]
MKQNIKKSNKSAHYFCMMYTGKYSIVVIENPKLHLEVANLQ